MFIFIDSEEFDALKEEELIGVILSRPVDRDDKPLGPHKALWLEDHDVESITFMGHTIISEKDEATVRQQLKAKFFGKSCHESEVLSVYLVHRLHDRIRDMENEK